MSTRTPIRNRREIGWTTDPFSSGQERYWDGTKFSARRTPRREIELYRRAAFPPIVAVRGQSACAIDETRAPDNRPRNAPAVDARQPEQAAATARAKRAVDVTGATILILLTLPVLGLLGLAIRLTSRGPAVYRSIRVGRDDREFVVYKLRTMYRDADSRKDDLSDHNEVIGGVLFKIHDDPRVTPVGRILRRCSLDELPQLFNVLGGSMSLVGPRPPLPDEVRQYTPEVHRRLLVKPGLTGLWQVSGRSDLSWDESVRLDLDYVENWSLKLDLIIIARTVSAVLHSTGAY